MSLLLLATPTIGPPPNTCCVLELASPEAVPGVGVTVCDESDPAAVFVPCCGEVVCELEFDPNPLFEPAPKALLELPPKLLPEFPPNALFEPPPNADDCENAELDPPNAELPDPEAFNCPTVFAPAIGVLPMLPPRVTPGSP